jgi:hypothetical protein
MNLYNFSFNADVYIEAKTLQHAVELFLRYQQDIRPESFRCSETSDIDGIPNYPSAEKKLYAICTGCQRPIFGDQIWECTGINYYHSYCMKP